MPRTAVNTTPVRSTTRRGLPSLIVLPPRSVERADLEGGHRPARDPVAAAEVVADEVHGRRRAERLEVEDVERNLGNRVRVLSVDSFERGAAAAAAELARHVHVAVATGIV